MKRRIVINELEDKQQSKLGRIIVLTGARQTGKTTIALHVFSDYKYFAIDDVVQSSNLKKLTASQWKTFYPQAVLDEVQKEPTLIDSIKATYDQFPDTRYLLLGSSQFLLMEKVKESLAGRCVVMEIYPLTLPELLSKSWDKGAEDSFFAAFIKNDKEIDSVPPALTLDDQYVSKKSIYDYYLRFGAYPALTDIDLTNNERDEWLSMYVKTFLERDVRDLASFRDLEPFIKLQLYLAQTTASLANFSSIAKETGTTVPTIQRYIRYMSLSYQSIILPSWHANPIKRLVKAPKIHFLDIGVLRAVLQKKGALSGSEYESAIVAEIYKQIKAYHLPLKCFHLRTMDGREVDLLLEAEDYYIAIEIKMTEHVNRTDIRHLKNLEDILNKPIRHTFVLSNDTQIQHFENNITAIHAASFLC